MIAAADPGWDPGILGWAIIGMLGVALYFLIVWAVWYGYLEWHDKRTPQERARHQAEEDEAQAEYLRRWHREHAKPMFSPAHKHALQAMRSMTPDTGEGPRMLFVNHPDLARAYRIRPGGFVFVKGPYKAVHDYFRSRNWERLPFTFMDRHIYRKPR